MDRTTRPWLLVGVAVVVMGLAGTYQFLWSSLSGAVGARFPAASPPALGTVFTLFIVTQTLAQFPAGRIRDRHGPRNVLLVAAACLFAGFVGVGLASSFVVVAAAYALGGAGAGIAYTVSVNTPVKWLPEDGRRGLGTGMVAMAYGATSALFIPLLRGSLDDAFTTTLLVLGGVAGVGGLLGAWLIRDPDDLPGHVREADANADTDDGDPGVPDTDGEPAGNDVDTKRDADPDAPTPATATSETETGATTSDSPSGRGAGRGVNVGWRTAIRTWQFWVLYAVMMIINGVGLMLIGQSVGYATGLGLSASVATVVASIVALADGAGVLVVSGLSDRFGGERTVGASLLVCGCALAGSVVVGSRGLAVPFVVLVAAAAFFRSPVFGIFPTLVAEYYGTARSSENYAAVYTAKLPGGVVGGTVAGALVVSLGWSLSFLAGAAFLVLAGVAALALRPVSLDEGADAGARVDSD